MNEPTCPKCGKHIFAFKYVAHENKVKKNPEAKGSIFALAYCVSCGHIIGFAGR